MLNEGKYGIFVQSFTSMYVKNSKRRVNKQGKEDKTDSKKSPSKMLQQKKEPTPRKEEIKEEIKEELKKEIVKENRGQSIKKAIEQDSVNKEPQRISPNKAPPPPPKIDKEVLPSLGATSKQTQEEKEKTVQSYLRNQRKVLINRMRGQMEYYFGDKNYHNDQFLHKNKDSNGYVALDKILTFNKLVRLGATKELIVEAIQGSSI